MANCKHNTIHKDSRHWKGQFQHRNKDKLIRGQYTTDDNNRGVRSVPCVIWYRDEPWWKWGLKGCLCSDFMLMVNTPAFFSDLTGKRNMLNVCGSLSGKRVPEHAVKLTWQQDHRRKWECTSSFLLNMKWVKHFSIFLNLMYIYENVCNHSMSCFINAWQ